MADYLPHPLVTELAQKLGAHGSELATAASKFAEAAQEAGGEAPPAAAHELADVLARQPDLPALMNFAGFLGGTLDDKKGVTKSRWRLLYLDVKLLTWLLIREEDILLSLRVGDADAKVEKRDVVWLKTDASLSHGSGPIPPDEIQARFLRGDFTRAADVAATLTDGPARRPDGRLLRPDAATAAGGRRGSRATADAGSAGAGQEALTLLGRERAGAARAGERAHLLEAAADLAGEDAHDLALAERRDLPVGAQCDVVELVLVGPQDRELGSGARVPQPQRAVLAGAQHQRTVAAEERRRDLVLMAAQHELRPAARIPHAHRAVGARRDDPPVAAVGEREHLAAVPFEPALGLGRAVEPPDQHVALLRHGREHARRRG